MKDVEFFVGEIAGLWKTTDPSTGKLACFFDRNGFDTIGLTGLVDPSEIQIRRGLSLCVAARLGIWMRLRLFTRLFGLSGIGLLRYCFRI